MFRGLRRKRDQAAQFLALTPTELQRRHFWLCRSLGLEGGAAAAYLAAQPSLLLAEPAEAAAVVSTAASACVTTAQAACSGETMRTRSSTLRLSPRISPAEPPVRAAPCSM